MPPKKKEEKPKDHFVEGMFILLVSGIFIFLWVMILRSLFSLQGIIDWFLKYLWPIIVVLGIVASVAALVGIIYNLRKLNALTKAEARVFGPSPEDEAEAAGPVVEKNEKWERVQTHINSSNPSDWRQAIIEGDVMLEEMLRTGGYQGDTLGDLLKGVDREDMLTLDSAWEAHKVRNQIAHSGADYQLTERDAKRVINLYESVFKESGII